MNILLIISSIPFKLLKRCNIYFKKNPFSCKPAIESGAFPTLKELGARIVLNLETKKINK